MVKPFLKWPGGKRWLAPKLVPLIADTFEKYIEPFLGGGAFLFALEPKRAMAADINNDLIICYKAIKKDPERVYQVYQKLQPEKEEYYRIRDEWNPESHHEHAARLIYLLHNSWNGLYRVNKHGKFNVPFRQRERKTQISLNSLVQTQKILTHVMLSCRDFSGVINKARKGDLIFADPPYFMDNKETFGKYSSVLFKEQEQAKLARSLFDAEHRGATWLLTNGCIKQVLNYYGDHDTFVLPRASVIAADPKARRQIEEFVVISNGSGLSSLRKYLSEQYKKL